MANEPTRTGKPFGLGIPGSAPFELSKSGVDAMTKMQAEFMGNLEELSRAWLSQTQASAALFNGLLTQLWNARSPPDTVAAYQQFMSRRMEMMVEDSRRFFASSEKFMNAGAKLLANGLAIDSATPRPTDKGGRSK
jgi:hypothetical protein